MYWTQQGIKVDERIADGQTKFFENELKAYEHARQVRSYLYPVVNKKRQIVGYGVPK